MSNKKIFQNHLLYQGIILSNTYYLGNIRYNEKNLKKGLQKIEQFRTLNNLIFSNDDTEVNTFFETIYKGMILGIQEKNKYQNFSSFQRRLSFITSIFSNNIFGMGYNNVFYLRNFQDFDKSSIFESLKSQMKYDFYFEMFYFLYLLLSIKDLEKYRSKFEEIFLFFQVFCDVIYVTKIFQIKKRKKTNFNQFRNDILYVNNTRYHNFFEEHLIELAKERGIYVFDEDGVVNINDRTGLITYLKNKYYSGVGRFFLNQILKYYDNGSLENEKDYVNEEYNLNLNEVKEFNSSCISYQPRDIIFFNQFNELVYQQKKIFENDVYTIITLEGILDILSKRYKNAIFTGGNNPKIKRILCDTRKFNLNFSGMQNYTFEQPKTIVELFSGLVSNLYKNDYYIHLFNSFYIQYDSKNAIEKLKNIGNKLEENYERLLTFIDKMGIEEGRGKTIINIYFLLHHCYHNSVKNNTRKMKIDEFVLGRNILSATNTKFDMFINSERIRQSLNFILLGYIQTIDLISLMLVFGKKFGEINEMIKKFFIYDHGEKLFSTEGIEEMKKILNYIIENKKDQIFCMNKEECQENIDLLNFMLQTFEQLRGEIFGMF